MNQFEHLVAEFQQLTPFRVRYKDESPEMEILGIFVEGFCPGFMTSYTTVIGSTIYFPSRHFIETRGDDAMRILAHEMVHLLDSNKWSTPVFMLGYLMPQILALGVFTFPWIGLWSLMFLLFLLPLPSPFRYYFESRAYAMDVLTTHPNNKAKILKWAVSQFSSWSYFKMFPFERLVENRISSWISKAEKGKDHILIQVLLLYEMVHDH